MMPKPLCLYINGRFLTQGLSGVQRYAQEMVLALDGLLQAGLLPPALQACRWILLMPKNTNRRLPLKIIAQEETGFFKGHLWEQTALYWAARHGLLLSFCNAGPLWHTRQLVTLHDASIYRFPQFYGLVYGLLHRTLGRLLARTARLATVSHFSARELSALLGVPENNIAVLSNSADHMARLKPDNTIIEKFGLNDARFFVCLGSLTPNKNMAAAITAFSGLKRTDAKLVIVGAHNKKIFNTTNHQTAANIIWAGRLSNEEVAALFSVAQALVFPSFYEGFGIPPLEAMFYGCPVLASTAPAVKEVCRDAAYYFNPHNPEELAGLMTHILDHPPSRAALKVTQQARLDAYSWKKSGQQLAEVIHEQFS